MTDKEAEIIALEMIELHMFGTTDQRFIDDICEEFGISEAEYDVITESFSPLHQDCALEIIKDAVMRKENDTEWPWVKGYSARISYRPE